MTRNLAAVVLALSSCGWGCAQRAAAPTPVQSPPTMARPSPAETANAEKISAAMEEQRQQIYARLKAMTYGMQLVPSDASLRLAGRATTGLRPRYLAAYGDGVLIGVRKYPEDTLRPYFSDGRTIVPVQIRGLEDVRSFVVARDGLWVAGYSGDRPVVLRIGHSRDEFKLPRHELAQLGIDDQGSPIAVYTDAVFRWTGGDWILLREGLKLPKTVMPPRLINSTLLVREEGYGENDKRLWWTDVDRNEPLLAHDQAIGFGWFDAPSYLFTRTGEFWFTTGNLIGDAWTLVRRSALGEYRLAIINGQTHFTGQWEPPAVNVSAIAELADGTLVGAGSRGFYQIDNDRIITIVRFEEAAQTTADGVMWRWDPTDILELSPNRYLISGLFGGIYLLDLSGDTYRLVELDERIGPPIEL